MWENNEPVGIEFSECDDPPLADDDSPPPLHEALQSLPLPEGINPISSVDRSIAFKDGDVSSKTRSKFLISCLPLADSQTEG